VEQLQHLALLAAVDARRRPAFLPAREEDVLLVDRFEAATLERGGLRMLDRALDRALISSQQLPVVLTTKHVISRSRTHSTLAAARGLRC
jgi:hypothetical protein